MDSLGLSAHLSFTTISAGGATLDLSQRATSINGTPNKPVLTDEEAAVIGDMNNTFGDWQPTLLTEQAPMPANISVNGSTLTWDDSDYTLLWAVCKDGSIVAFTTDPMFTVTESGTYSVRAANEMGGLSAASESVTISDDVVTGIQEIENGRLKIENSAGAVYDLQGRRMESSIFNSQSSILKKGLYIIDRHKFLVK